jgi:hypothetical protein
VLGLDGYTRVDEPDGLGKQTLIDRALPLYSSREEWTNESRVSNCMYSSDEALPCQRGDKTRHYVVGHL